MSASSAGAPMLPLVLVNPLTSSVNLAGVTVRLAVALLIALSLVLLTRLVFFPPPKRSLTLTELNTLLNRHENGGTGVVARKWRRRFFPPVRYGDEHELAGGGIDEVGVEWTFTSRPTPDGLRGCLRRVVVETNGDKAVEVVEETDGRSSPAPRSAKSVRVVEPDLDDIRALRELWASPEMQGPGGLGGIGGYRRTRDFYSKSQGGTAVVKRTTTDVAPVVLKKSPGPGSVIPATKEDESETVTEDEDDSDTAPLKARRGTRVASLALSTSRSSSLSPSPANRRQRPLSPTSPSNRSGSPAFVVGAAAKSSPSRRRALSPTLGTAPRSSSLSPGPPPDRPVVPKWVKMKNGKLASPAPSKLGRGAGVDESETTEEEIDEDEGEGEDPDAPPATGLATTIAGIAAVAAAIPPIPSDASIAIAPPSSSPASVLSGGESPQESPTPALQYQPGRPPKLAITSAPPLEVHEKSPSHLSSSLPSPPASPVSAQPTASPPTASPASKHLDQPPSPVSPSPSPSPCVKAERRLSRRVQQSLKNKQHKQVSSTAQASVRGAA